MSTDGENLIAFLDVLSARLDALIATPLAGTHDQRPRLQATPQGMQVLRETMARLLASGDLWWRDAEEPPAPK